MNWKNLGTWVLLCAGLATAAAAETVRVEADRDATLIEDPAGAWANGSGPFAFAGRIDDDVDSRRRTLIRFDVAAALPEGAVVERVSLSLYQRSSNSEPRIVTVHRILADWSEGPASSIGGGGAPSGPGDATWIHRSYDDTTWARPGGRFVFRPSGALVVAGNGTYAWTQEAGMLRDVRLWQAAPGRNFGWLLRGDEGARRTAKRFASRENPEPGWRPVLEIQYRPRRGGPIRIARTGPTTEGRPTDDISGPPRP